MARSELKTLSSYLVTLLQHFLMYLYIVQQLKDHFQIAGQVAFASISVDKRTGESKQCGIVQYEVG